MGVGGVLFVPLIQKRIQPIACRQRELLGHPNLHRLRHVAVQQADPKSRCRLRQFDTQFLGAEPVLVVERMLALALEIAEDVQLKGCL